MHVRHLLSFILLFCGIFFLPLLHAAPDTAALETIFIKLHHRAAAEVLPQVKTLLSGQGRAAADIGTNSLIVIDTPGQLREIRDLVAHLDRPTPQVIVLVRMRASGSDGRLLSTDSGIRSARPGLTLATGAGNWEKTLRLTLTSGSSGFLTIGRQVPLTRTWLDLCGRHGLRAGWLTDYQTFASGLSVQPLVLDHAVQLTLTPALRFAQGRELVFAEAGTRVMVPPDTWTPIAAATNADSALSAVLLSGQARQQSGSMVLEVKALAHKL